MEESETVHSGAPASDMMLLAAEIVSAYVSRNSVPPVDLPGLIRSVHAALMQLGSRPAPVRAQAGPIEHMSSAAIRKSVQHNGIVSFIDGKTYKTLKRHLTSRGLDPSTYRERYGLPADYPMVAPGYAEQRSALAKAIGLGRPGAASRQVSRKRRAA